MKPITKPLYRVDGVHGLFADAAAWDQASGELFFISLWGRDTAIQELLARLSLPAGQGGFSSFNLTASDGGKTLISVSNPGRLDKLSGRMPTANLFGALAHAWVFVPSIRHPDFAGHRALMIAQGGGHDLGLGDDAFISDAVWPLFKDASHLPLLDEWRKDVIRVAVEHGWLKCHGGLAVDVLEIDLSAPDYETVICDLIRAGQLRLPGESSPPVHSDNGGGPAENADSPSPGNKRLTGEGLESHLCQFSGTENWYRHGLVKGMLYTDGVKSFAEKGGAEGAYWFLDVVATEIFPLLRNEPFLSIVLSVQGRKATVKVVDGNCQMLWEKRIDFTDMQTGDWKFYLTDNVLLLPGEY
ncbi:MAG: hypothetical protein DM484_05310 [Candidatus Methylumidiphilus alinenensis]|uniref:DUF6876 domain-containing protein n=1 Tax=Candidatus Methylumidiphilus alinenensis TaxID=2202197 RepID=A0A2W4RJ11_9GAMM|nr:MAG: hypothetical protein DM484_05310 [Candidatus Methylumidiphilus alinenensis]